MTRRALVHISSKVKDLDGLVIRGVPHEPVAVVKAVRVENIVVMVGADGVLYSSGLRVTGAYAFSDDFSGSLHNEFRGLQRLGVLSKVAVEQHRALTTKIKAEKERRWAAQSILDRSGVAGLKLTAAQRRKLEAAAAVEGGAA